VYQEQIAKLLYFLMSLICEIFTWVNRNHYVHVFMLYNGTNIIIYQNVIILSKTSYIPKNTLFVSYLFESNACILQILPGCRPEGFTTWAYSVS
jgi:hypothetical protein